MIYHDVQQGTEEWLRLKAGKFSASKFEKLFMGKTTQGYNDVIAQVVCGKLTGETPKDFTSRAMKNGTETEPIARKRYEMETFEDVRLSGFYELNEWVGCSLDGEIGDDKILEIKCPQYNTMINYLLNPEKLYADYKYQTQGQLWVANKQRSDLVAFYPKLPLLIFPIQRDETLINAIKKETDIAIAKAQEIIIKLKGQSNG